MSVFQELAKEIKGAADRYGVCAAADVSWLKGEDPERFYDNPLVELKRLYNACKGDASWRISAYKACKGDSSPCM
ncbi:MAG: hypothetical protein RQM95_14705 [Syntrophaceticus schinkii]